MTDITGATLLAKVLANTIVAASPDPDPVVDDKYIEALCDAVAEEINDWIDTVFATHTHIGSPTAPLGSISPTGVPNP